MFLHHITVHDYVTQTLLLLRSFYISLHHTLAFIQIMIILISFSNVPLNIPSFNVSFYTFFLTFAESQDALVVLNKTAFFFQVQKGTRAKSLQCEANATLCVRYVSESFKSIVGTIKL